MTNEFNRSFETLRHAADISHALAGQLVELLKLRETVQNAEAAAIRSKTKCVRDLPAKDNAKPTRRAM